MAGPRTRALWSLLLILGIAGVSACAPKRMAPVTAVSGAAAPAGAVFRNSPGARPASGGSQPTFEVAESDSLDLEAAEAALELAYGPLDEEGYPGVPLGPPAPGEMPQDAQLVPADPEAGDRVAELASTQVGKPYGWGSSGPDRFDCSGLALYVYRQLGIALPRVSCEQASTGVHIDRSELRPGDLVFFSMRRAFDHVGIFLGNNKFVHAPRRHEPVRVDNLDDAWWNRAYRGARRVLGGQP